MHFVFLKHRKSFIKLENGERAYPWQNLCIIPNLEAVGLALVYSPYQSIKVSESFQASVDVVCIVQGMLFFSEQKIRK